MSMAEIVQVKYTERQRKRRIVLYYEFGTSLLIKKMSLDDLKRPFTLEGFQKKNLDRNSSTKHNIECTQDVASFAFQYIFEKGAKSR